MPASHAAQVVYFTFQIFGLVTLPILACTFIFSSTAKRHCTVINNALVWALSSAVACLLLFTRQLDGREPSRILCHAQSALMFAQPAAMATAALSLVWKVWSLTWRIKRNSAVVDEPLWLTCILLGLPYLVWGVPAGIYAVVQAKSNVHIVTFYCTSDNPTLALASSVLAAIALVLCLVFQIWTMALVYLRFRKSNRLRRALGRHVTVPFFIRTIVFMVMVFVALVLCFVALSTFSLEAPDIIISSCGVITFFIFASQGDVLVCWYLKRSTTRATDSRITSELSRSDPLPMPATPLGMLHEPSQSSLFWELPKGSKNTPHLAIRVEQIELTTRNEPSIGDCKSSPSFDQCSSSHAV